MFLRQVGQLVVTVNSTLVTGSSGFNKMLMCVTAAAMDVNEVDEDQFEDVDDE